MSRTVIHRRIPRPSPALIELLRGIPVADLHDEMSVIDRRCRLMSPAMRPLLPGKAFVGPAVTAYNTAGDNLMMHAALYYAAPGDVLVVSNGGVAHGALWGGNATIQAVRKGIAAVVADGPVRDIAQVRENAFGVWSTCISVSKPGKEAPGTVNVPIHCAGVIVNPGDIVVGDEDGIIVVDPADAERIATRARARIERDARMQASIARGATLFEEIGGPKQLAALDAEIIDRAWNE